MGFVGLLTRKQIQVATSVSEELAASIFRVEE
jgi:hypothetical protein